MASRTMAARAGTSDANAEQELIAFINSHRANTKCVALRHNTLLAATAEAHSYDMAAHGFVSTQGSDGTSPQQRMARAGYRSASTDEIVISGRSTAEQVQLSMILNTTTRQQILNCAWSDIGVGMWTLPGSKDGTYWTIDLGIGS
ncbi:MAG: CAP domain-containing protein [Angustibacter sp.]